MKTIFFRALEASDKEQVLCDAIQNPEVAAGQQRFEVDPATFAYVPRSPFAYWVSDRLRGLFVSLGRFGNERRFANAGTSTGDDRRFIRNWWEVRLDEQAWRYYTKGGRRSTFYADPFALVDWRADGVPIELSFAGGRVRKPFYGRPGLTWPLRGIRFSAQAVPPGCVFSVAGKMAFVDASDLTWTLALFNSLPFDKLVAFFAGKVGGVQYEVGLIQNVPVPTCLDADQRLLGSLASRAWSLKRTLDTVTETSHAFSLPAVLQVQGETLAARTAAWAERVRAIEEELAIIQAEIDDRCFTLYGIDQTDRKVIMDGFGGERGEAEEEPEDVTEDEAENETEYAGIEATSLAAKFLSWAVGLAFGRLDVRLATGARELPPEPEPFDSLPISSPGMLQNEAGLPLTPEDVARLEAAGQWHYPIPFPWDGILVDDPGHPRDLEARLQQVLQVIWQERDQGIEREACELLGARSLREYFANFATGKKSGFFDDHLKRYSKSRRTAPIYWPLSTPSGSYTLWVYYHRLTDQTLYTCVNDFVDVKLRQVTAQVNALRHKSGRSSPEEQALEQLAGLELELQDFRAELLRIAAFWKPDLNDGVQITAAPLWRLFQHRPWQKKLKETWESLEAGEYDWAHLAMCIRPAQVREKCRTDKSLAIAHGLEPLYEAPPEPAGKKRGKKAKAGEVQGGLFEGE